MNREFEIATALARLLGHSFGAAVGFCVLAGISLIPIAAVNLALWLGATELVRPLRILEQLLLFADVLVFAVIFLSGLAVFASKVLDSARRQIRLNVRRNRRDK